MDNAPGVRFVSLTFLVGFGIGAFIGVGLALIAVAIALPEDEDPKFIEIAVIATATTTPEPDDTPVPPLRATAAAAVRIGPGEEYATLGTITSGDVLDVVGRDFDSEWLAIRFPAGSSSRGWIPVSVAGDLGFANLEALAVLLPTPLPIEFVTPPPFLGTPGTPGTGTPGVEEGTPHPQAGTFDLAVFEVRALADGRVRVVVLNGGPEDLTQGVLVVEVRTFGAEVERLYYSDDLPAGGTLALATSSLTVGEEEETIQVVIDAAASLPDPNRENNVLTTSLSRPQEPTATPEDGESG